MAHGTPADADGASRPSTPGSGGGDRPTPAQLAELAARYAAIGGVSPLAERTRAQVDGARAELDRAIPGTLRRRLRREAHRAAHRGGGRPAGRPAGSDRGDRARAHPALVVHGLGGVPRARPRHGVGRDGPAGWPVRARRATGTTPPGFAELLAERVTARQPTSSHGDPAGGRLHRPLVAGADRGRRATPTRSSWPTSAAARRPRPPALDRLVGGWQSAGRTPDPWLGPDVRDEVRRPGRDGRCRRRRGLPGRLRGRPSRGPLRPRRRGPRGGRGRDLLRPHGVAERRSGLHRGAGRVVRPRLGGRPSGPDRRGPGGPERPDRADPKRAS